MIERRLENLLALDYPADQLEIVVASDASDRPHRRDRRGVRGARAARAAAALPARRQGRGAEPGGRASPRPTSSPSPTPTAPGRPTRCGCSSASFADPDVAYVCGRLVLQDADGTNREGTYWRLETWLREQEAQTGSITGGNGSIYAVRRARLRRRRPALRARPVLPVPDGAARPARGLRPGGARVREAVARHRGRVRAQGADVRALLGDRRRGDDARRPAARLPRRDRLAPASSLRRAASCTSSCSARASRSRPRRDLPRGAGRAARVPRRCGRAGRACRATTRS